MKVPSWLRACSVTVALTPTSILRASANPFFAQFRDVVATALRTSIRFTNRIQGRSADLASHEAVLRAIEARDPDASRNAMLRIIEDVMEVIVHSSPSSAA